MVEYKCKKCGTVFNKKYNFETHMNRKTSCVSGSKTNKNNDHDCKNCGKFYSRKDALKRHSKICKGDINRIFSGSSYRGEMVYSD